MAFSHGSTAVLKVADSGAVLRDLSAYLTDAGLTTAIDTVETSTLGSVAKSYIAGLEDHTFSLTGDFDPTVDGYLDGIRRKTVTWEYYPAGLGGAGGTNVKYSGSAIMTKYDPASAVGAVNTFAADFQVSGAVTRALV